MNKFKFIQKKNELSLNRFSCSVISSSSNCIQEKKEKKKGALTFNARLSLARLDYNHSYGMCTNYTLDYLCGSVC
jgi:hypothetical protein